MNYQEEILKSPFKNALKVGVVLLAYVLAFLLVVYIIMWMREDDPPPVITTTITETVTTPTP